LATAARQWHALGGIKEPHLLNANHKLRGGFTLLEMLLVLALMSALAAVAIPSFQGPLADRRLRSSAEHVRAAWLTARSEAMTSAQIYMFRYEPQTGDYTIGPWDGDGSGVETASNSLSVVSGAPTTLPEGVTFVGGSTQQDTRSAAVDATGASAIGGSSAPPVLFYTDGSTSTVELQLAHEIGLGVTLSMRGLTGVVTVSDTYSLEEAAR
jgi:prepilin-type N-terminal cleavage/methylation domain-containing protein